MISLGCSSGGGGLSTALADGKIYVGNASNVATAVTPTGDVLLSNTGVTSYNGVVPLNKGGAGVSAAQSDVSTTGTINALVWTSTFTRLTGASTIAINGITAPAVAGTRLSLFIVNNISCTALNESASASATNRLSLPNGQALTMQQRNIYDFVYDGTQQRWFFAGGYRVPVGTANQVNVGTVGGLTTLSLPQNIDTFANPTFNSILNQVGYSVIEIENGMLRDGVSNQLIYDINAGGVGYDKFTGSVSFNQQSRILFDNAGSLSVGWQDRQLLDSSNRPAIWWENRQAIDTSSTTSIDWGGRVLADQFGNTVINWSLSSGTIDLNNIPSTVGASSGTLNNCTSNGDPVEYIQIQINGNTRYIPCWA